MRMGVIDTEAKAYLSAPDKVADAFNYWVYGGRDIIKPEGLTPLDTTAIVLPYGNEADPENPGCTEALHGDEGQSGVLPHAWHRDTIGYSLRDACP